MTRAEIKREAKDTLRGRWGTIIGMILIYGLIILGMNYLADKIPYIGSLAIAVITVPLSFGFIGQMLKYSRKQEVGYFDFFKIGFDNFGKAWSIVGRTLLKLLPFVIAYVVCLILLIIIAAVAGAVIFTAVFGAAGAATVDLNELNNALQGTLAGAAILLPITVIAYLVVTILLTMQSYFYVLTEYIGNDNPEMSAKDVVEKSKELMKGHRWEYFVLNLSFIGWILLANLTLGIGYLWLVPYMQVTMIKYYENLAGIVQEPKEEEVIQENI